MLLASFSSGAAALIYELLLFERARLILGSSVSAGAWVLGAWMAGLALGSAAGRWHALPAWPARRYAQLELLVVALAMMAVLPGDGWPISVFLLLIVATSGLLGLTTPLLAELGLRQAGPFVARIRWLYASNTAGAVLGVLLGLLLLRQAGVPAALTAGVAGSLLAAALIWRAGAAFDALRESEESVAVSLPARSLTPLALCAGAFGFALLWAEVLGMRMLPYFARGTAENFALLLATVIGGLSLGAMLPARTRLWTSYGAIAALTLPWLVEGWSLPHNELARATLLALLWLLPLALISGAGFASLCERARALAPHSGHAIGSLAAVNALGAAAGALVGGLWLLPRLGLQASWMLLCGLLVLLALAVQRPHGGRGAPWATVLVLLLVLGGCLQQGSFLESWRVRASAAYGAHQRVAAIEAMDADQLLLRSAEPGAVPSWRLMTDAYSMSNTAWDSQRYMRLFAALPQLLHPRPQSALLISYGLGNTADQLLLDQRLEHLVVADTSAATIALARRINPTPLDDARTELHIEDGRQLLRRRPGQFDLITAEPPPPRLAGIQNLYSQEYFALVHRALRPGGFASHWLPVDQLSSASSQAIVAAFCAVFRDCSLWSGSHYNWMLLGSRDARPPTDWPALQQPAWRGAVARIGLEQAWQWPALYLADAAQLARWVNNAAPLSDDYPGRLQSRGITAAELQGYFLFADERAAEQRLQASAWARSWLQPLGMQPNAWLWQPLLDGRSHPEREAWPALAVASLGDGLRLPLLRVLGLEPAHFADTSAPDVDQQFLHGLQRILQGDARGAREALKLAQDARAPGMLQVAECLSGLARCP